MFAGERDENIRAQCHTWTWRLVVLRSKMVIRSCDVGFAGSAYPTSDHPKVHGRYSMSLSARSTPI